MPFTFFLKVFFPNLRLLELCILRKPASKCLEYEKFIGGFLVGYSY